MEEHNEKALLLDLSKLLSGEEDEIRFDESLQPDIDDPDIRLESAVRFTGVVKECGGFVQLKATIGFEFSGSCARCLAPVKESLSIPLEMDGFEQDKMPEDSDEEPFEVVDSKIDLVPLVYEAIFTNLPGRLLCKEDCLGLCPHCGGNLNLSDCGCAKKQVDPRLAGLMDFFNEQ